MIKMGSTWVRKMQAEQWQGGGQWDRRTEGETISLKQLEHTIKNLLHCMLIVKRNKSK